MFQVNNYVVYGGDGVCRILGVGIPDTSMFGKKKQYYKLEPVYGNASTIYTPVDNDKVIIRKVISKEEANELINDISSIETLTFDNDKMLKEKYKEAMHTCDCKELIKVIKTSYSRKEERLAEGKKNATMDDKYLKMAEEYLFGELSISLNIPKEKVEDLIVNQVKHSFNS